MLHRAAPACSPPAAARCSRQACGPVLHEHIKQAGAHDEREPHAITMSRLPGCVDRRVKTLRCAMLRALSIAATCSRRRLSKPRTYVLSDARRRYRRCASRSRAPRSSARAVSSELAKLVATGTPATKALALRGLGRIGGDAALAVIRGAPRRSRSDGVGRGVRGDRRRGLARRSPRRSPTRSQLPAAMTRRASASSCSRRSGARGAIAEQAAIIEAAVEPAGERRRRGRARARPNGPAQARVSRTRRAAGSSSAATRSQRSRASATPRRTRSSREHEPTPERGRGRRARRARRRRRSGDPRAPRSPASRSATSRPRSAAAIERCAARSRLARRGRGGARARR